LLQSNKISLDASTDANILTVLPSVKILAVGH